jgi:tRNA threonylcarbamoyladenosine biosynthesis protein TsaE
MVNTYQREDHRDTVRDTVYHFDLYRVQTLEELEAIGFEEYLHDNAIVLIEWPQIATPLLPEQAVILKIEVPHPDFRELTIHQ